MLFLHSGCLLPWFWELSLSDTVRMLSVGCTCSIDMLQLNMLGFDSYSLALFQQQVGAQHPEGIRPEGASF